MLCGAVPLPATSGMTTRHQLNRGRDRAAKSTLHMIPNHHQPPADGPHHRGLRRRNRAEGHSNPEILRCLKRYLAREVYYLLRNQHRAVRAVV